MTLWFSFVFFLYVYPWPMGTRWSEWHVSTPCAQWSLINTHKRSKVLESDIVYMLCYPKILTMVHINKHFTCSHHSTLSAGRKSVFMTGDTFYRWCVRSLALMQTPADIAASPFPGTLTSSQRHAIIPTGIFPEGLALWPQFCRRWSLKLCNILRVVIAAGSFTFKQCYQRWREYFYVIVTKVQTLQRFPQALFKLVWV